MAAETRGTGDSRTRLRNLLLYASSAFDFECQALEPRDRLMGDRRSHGVIACGYGGIIRCLYLL